MKISLRRRQAPTVGNGACSHKIDYYTFSISPALRPGRFMVLMCLSVCLLACLSVPIYFLSPYIGGLRDWAIGGLGMWRCGDGGIGGLEPFLTSFDRFGPFLKDFLSPCWTVVDCFWLLYCLTVIDCFWPYWPFLAVYHTRTKGPIVGHMRHFF